MNRCQKCNIELPEEARFCNVCGSPQGPADPLPTATTANEQEKPAAPKPLAQPRAAVPVVRSIQFRSRIWPNTPDATAQPATPAPASQAPQVPQVPRTPQVQPGIPGSTSQGGKARPTPQPGFSRSTYNRLEAHAPIPRHAQSLFRPVGIAPVRPAQPTTSDPASHPAPSQPQRRLVPPYTPPQAYVQHRQQFAERQIKQNDAAPDQQARATNNPNVWPWRPSAVDKLPTSHLPAEAVNEQATLASGYTQPSVSPERFTSTSKAAERWRDSWRDRQRAEAGPVEKVSRGQASVPMPLMAMQQSFVRMRAIINANKPQQDSRNNNLSFWVTIFLLICLIGGLGTYIISSYLPNLPFGAARLIPPVGAAQPSLTIEGVKPEAVVAGQTLHLHGEHFGTNETISFLLDTTTPITNAAGQNISVQANDQGAFDAALPVGSNWTAGTHVIEAVDGRNDQNAYLTIQVNPPGTPVTSSSDLALTLDGQALQQLKFTAVLGQGNPSKRITLSNTSGAPLKWTAVASANNNLSWLVINDNHTYGNLDISGTDTMGISAIITGLQSTTNKKPYTGQLIFTINNTERLTLPVQLQVAEAPAELVFSPNPIVAHVGPGGTCQTGPQSGATLTLINLGDQVISWKLGMDSSISSHLHFITPSSGQPTTDGLLAASDQSTDQFSATQVLDLQCTGVKAGDSFTISIYANGLQWPELILIQT